MTRPSGDGLPTCTYTGLGVTSKNIYGVGCHMSHPQVTEVMHLEDLAQLSHNLPLLVAQLKLS